MNKFQLFAFFCNIYNALLANGVDLSEVDKFLSSRERYYHPGPFDTPYETFYLNLKIWELKRAILMMIGTTPLYRWKKGEKFVSFSGMEAYWHFKETKNAK